MFTGGKTAWRGTDSRRLRARPAGPFTRLPGKMFERRSERYDGRAKDARRKARFFHFSGKKLIQTSIIYYIYMYIYIIIAYLLRVYIYAQIIFISSIFVRLFVHHHLKHIFMNHSYCFDETPLGQVTQVTRRYCRTWRLTPFSSSAVRLGDDENFPNIFLEFQILVRKNINPRSRVNILQNILENILVNCKGVLSFPLSYIPSFVRSFVSS